MFAPTDDAVTKLGSAADAVLADKTVLKEILLFHVVDDVVSSEDLVCSGRVEMANGQDSRTVCQGQKVFQKGGTNPRNDMPQIIQTDITTCQGFIHVVGRSFMLRYNFFFHEVCPKSHMNHDISLQTQMKY